MSFAAAAFPSVPKYQTCAFRYLTHLFQDLASRKPGAQLVARPLVPWVAAGTALSHAQGRAHRSLAAPGTNRARPRTGRGVGTRRQEPAAAGPPSLGRPLPAPRPSSAVFPPRSTQPRLRGAAEPRTRRPASAPRPRRSPTEAEAPAPGRHATFQCPICSPGSSPGSRVQSSRGAVREMQLRFLSTLLRMVPTPPPPPPPPCRFRHLPPRLREPVSLSCRIRERPGLRCGHRPPWVPATPPA